MVKAPRPFQVDNTITGKRAQTATGFSFPSGHTQAATVTFVSIAINYKKKFITICAILIPFFVALSRMYLGVHFLKDVVVGAILGIGLSFLLNFLYTKCQNNKKIKLITYSSLIIIFLPFTFIFYKSNFIDIEIYRDFYISFALFIGAFLGFIIENKYVDFNCLSPLKTKVIRYILGLIVILIIYLGLKFVFPAGYIFLDMLRYFLVSFIGLGIYPLYFKKLKLL